MPNLFSDVHNGNFLSGYYLYTQTLLPALIAVRVLAKDHNLLQPPFTFWDSSDPRALTPREPLVCPSQLSLVVLHLLVLDLSSRSTQAGVHDHNLSALSPISRPIPEPTN